MKLTIEQVQQLAHLARLQLSPEEQERLSKELTSILDYVDILKEAETEDVPETKQVTGLSNVSRKDEIDLRLCKPEALLECSPLPKKDHQIAIKRMM